MEKFPSSRVVLRLGLALGPKASRKCTDLEAFYSTRTSVTIFWGPAAHPSGCVRLTRTRPSCLNVSRDTRRGQQFLSLRRSR